MSAEFGRSGGAVLNVTIKSGTNNFHGSVSSFYATANSTPRTFSIHLRDLHLLSAEQLAPRLEDRCWFPKFIMAKTARSFSWITKVRESATSDTFSDDGGARGLETGNFSGFNTVFDPNTTVTRAMEPWFASRSAATRSPWGGSTLPRSS